MKTNLLKLHAAKPVRFVLFIQLFVSYITAFDDANLKALRI